MVEVLKNIHIIEQSRPGRIELESYVLNCKEGVVIVDAGWDDEALEKIYKEIGSMGKTLEDIKLCLISHRHGDHIGPLPKLRETTNAQIMAHEEEVSDIEKAKEIILDKGLKDGEILPFCGGIQIVHVPGHTKGNICLYLEDHNLMLANDTIFGNEDGNLIPPPERYCTDVQLAKKGIERLLDYDFDVLLIAHGKNILKDAKRLVTKLCQTS